MQRMCKACGNWHDLDQPWPCGQPSKGSAPYVISDNMEPARHMGTGRMIDSKAKFRADTKASGCIEMGNSMPTPRQPIKLDKAQRRDDIKRTIYELRNGTRHD